MAKKTDKISADLQSGGRNHLLECVNLPAVLVDYQSMEIVKNNQQAALLFELPRKLSKFMLTELPPHFNRNINHMEIQEFPAQLLNKKGERLRVMVKVLPYRQNEAPQLLFMFKILSPRNLTQVSYEYLQVKRMLDNLISLVQERPSLFTDYVNRRKEIMEKIYKMLSEKPAGRAARVIVKPKKKGRVIR